jgi:hypothetical protein
MSDADLGALDPAWISHHFEWKRGGDGTGRLVPWRMAVVPCGPVQSVNPRTRAPSSQRPLASADHCRRRLARHHCRSAATVQGGRPSPDRSTRPQLHARAVDAARVTERAARKVTGRSRYDIEAAARSSKKGSPPSGHALTARPIRPRGADLPAAEPLRAWEPRRSRCPSPAGHAGPGGGAGDGARRRPARPRHRIGRVRRTQWIRLARPILPGDSATFAFEWSFTPPPSPSDGRRRKTLLPLVLVPAGRVYDDVNGWVTDPYINGAEFYMGMADYDVVTMRGLGGRRDRRCATRPRPDTPYDGTPRRSTRTWRMSSMRPTWGRATRS